MKIHCSSGAKEEYYFREGCYVLELSNTEDDPLLSIARIRVAPGVNTRWHRLINTSERYVILQGKGNMEVGDQGAFDVAADDVIRIEPGVAQRISNTGTADLVFLAICTPRFVISCYEEV